MELNLLLSLVPSPFTAAMIASAMPAAIKPYSIAVAPVSSRQNFVSNRTNPSPFHILNLLDRNAGFSRDALSLAGPY